MSYIVVAPDGTRSSAETVAVLRSLQLDGRMLPGSQVVVASTGRVLSDVELDGLLSGSGPVLDATPRPLRAESAWPIVSVTLWSIAALVWFFVFRGWGFIIAAFTLWDAIRLKSARSKWGNLALAIAGATALVIAWGWYDRVLTGQTDRPAVQSPGS